MIRPWVAPREIKIDLPRVIVESLGSGAEVLASYLTQLAETGVEDPAQHPPPLPVLCRICERQISPWWFEKHTELCLQEHRAEMDVQMAQEALTEHRHAIVKVLDALEARQSRSMTGEQSSLPVAEYKGLPIGPPPSSNSSPGSGSPVPGARSRDRSSGFGHTRNRSFAVRRPQARIVELLLDLCDTALEISTPALKDNSANQAALGEFRTQSPQSESRIAQVMQWETPTTNTLEQEQGLALLCSDTEHVVKRKVDAVQRHRRILEYSERIRIEFAYMVQDCIDAAMRKAAKIAAGRLSDSTEEEEEEDIEMPPVIEEGVFAGSFEDPSALELALEKADIEEDPDKRRLSRMLPSPRSASPKECPTPRSTRGVGGTITGPAHSRRGSMILESDACDSDGSLLSSVATKPPQRTDSPMSEFGDLRRHASQKKHKRRSLILPGAVSPRRQESPSRAGHPPSSPLRIHKPRNLAFPGVDTAVVSPEASPMLPSSEFTSPNAHHTYHHRRQSSTAVPMMPLEGGPAKPPPSPRLSAVVGGPQAKAVAPSIKDFEIIKPISKGAFGSVYLSKKKSTGEYFAIKVLKKADMVAKNQVTNVKAERAIMMWQGESDFVAKLYWTFSSKDYLYLVMEYMNGGDCASLIKVLGGLPEDWVKKYIGEVVLGVEHLHSRGIVHRDLKPDNLLIDSKGHLKLTDFGLSRMGLIGRQKRALNSGAEAAPDILKHGPFARSASMASSRSTSMDLHGRSHSPGSTPLMTPSDCYPSSLGQPSCFTLGSLSQEPRRVSAQRSDSNGSEALTHMISGLSLNESHNNSQAVLSPPEGGETEAAGSPDLVALSQPSTHNSVEYSKETPAQSSMPPPNWALFDPEDTNRRFVGTPDYLAPETIKGEPQDETSDWWSVGCIMYEFLYGIPPFHASTPDEVFENILARRLHWPPEDEDEVSPEAKDLINKLLCMDPQQRLGANRDEKFKSGGEEIRSHPWFKDINWDTLLQDEAQFVPNVENPEDTEYFDSRGATLQNFADEIEDQSSTATPPVADYIDRPHDALSRARAPIGTPKRSMPLHIPPHVRDLKSRRLSEPVAADDFGNFSFKNLPVLEKANKEVIQKLRTEALAAQNKPITPGGLGSLTSPGPGTLEGSPVISNPVQRTLSNAKASQRPQSPGSVSHANSSPSRVSQPSSPLLVSFHAPTTIENRRKTASNDANTALPSGNSLQPGTFIEVARVPPSLQKAATTIAAASPARGRGQAPQLPSSPQRTVPSQLITTPRHGGGPAGGRSRSLTVGSQEGSPIAADSLMAYHRHRRSQLFDMSPSSSDNEGDKAALLRVQRRRQSSRRMSTISTADASAFREGPTFRPLDVLICDDHPVSRMVMEKLLEKLRCRTISAATGSEALRYAMSDIKFDIIFLEYKLPQLTGSDVARMIRDTKNTNTHTPVVAITSYLKELPAPQYFDSLVEKPISSSKLTEVLSTLCHWKPAPSAQTTTSSSTLAMPHPATATLRQASLRAEYSPSTASASSGYALQSNSSFREDSVTSSVYGDSESVATDDIPVLISRKATSDWDENGLGITGPDDQSIQSSNNNTVSLPSHPRLYAQQSASAQMEHPVPLRSNKISSPHHPSLDKFRSKRDSIERRPGEGSVDSADDEDEEFGGTTSGLGVLVSSGHPSNSSGSCSTPGSPLSIASTAQAQYRSKTVLPSSKLAIEMMRANSHDSVPTPAGDKAEIGAFRDEAIYASPKGSPDSTDSTVGPATAIEVATVAARDVTEKTLDQQTAWPKEAQQQQQQEQEREPVKVPTLLERSPATAAPTTPSLTAMTVEDDRSQNVVAATIILSPPLPAPAAEASTPVLHSKAEQIVSAEEEVTPRPPAVTTLVQGDFVDDDPTPRRPPVRTVDRDNDMSPFPGAI